LIAVSSLDGRLVSKIPGIAGDTAASGIGITGKGYGCSKTHFSRGDGKIHYRWLVDGNLLCTGGLIGSIQDGQRDRIGLLRAIDSAPIGQCGTIAVAEIPFVNSIRRGARRSIGKVDYQGSAAAGSIH